MTEVMKPFAVFLIIYVFFSPRMNRLLTSEGRGVTTVQAVGVGWRRFDQ